MPKPSLWKLKTTRPIQEQREPQVSPPHSPDWCTRRAGEHDQSIFCGTLSETTLWVPFSHPGTPFALLPPGMKPAASPMTPTYGHSALRLLMTCEPKGDTGPGNYFYPFPHFPIYTKPDQNNPSSISWQGFLVLVRYASMYVTKIPSRGLREGCLNPVKRQQNNLKGKEYKIKCNAK